MNRPISLLITFIFFCFYILKGQTTSYMQFDRIHTNTDASVFGCIMQDSSGMIWTGTNNGLFSYDGYSFHRHNSSIAEKENYDVRIYCGIIHSDSIFLGTDNGLISYNKKKGVYLNHNTQGIKDIRCMTLSETELWLGTLNGLYRYNIKSKEIYEFPLDKLPHPAIYSCIISTDGNLYIGTYNGMCRIDTDNNVSPIYIPAEREWKNVFVNVILEDKEKNCIWIGTEGNLYCYDINKKQTKLVPYFSNNSIKSLNYDSEKNLLIGTDYGLYIYSTDNNTQRHYIHNSINDKSISNNIIWSIMTDKEHNIWLGTDNGISFSGNNQQYTFIPVWELSKTNDGNMFYSILTDSKGRCWFGGSDGLILSDGLYNENKSRWFKVDEKDSELSHNRIRCIYEDKSCNIWIATDGSIERYDEKNKNFVHYTIMDSTYTHNSNWAYFISEDNDSNIWVSSCLGGIFVINKEKLIRNNSGICIADYNFTTANGLESMFVKQAVVDKNGDVWVLMYNIPNIQKINYNNKKIESFSVCSEINEFPEYMICDSDGKIWVGSNWGISKIDPESGKTIRIKGEWENSNILYLTEVVNNIWISSSNGLFCIDKETLDIKRIYIKDKIYSSLYYDNRAQKIYMGSYDGIGCCEPCIIDTPQTQNKIYLTAFHVNNNCISKGIIDNTDFTLSNKENNLTFEFSDLVYNKYQRSGFIYTMSGIDSEWHYTNNNSNIIVYNNMPYGEFKLYIKSLGSNSKSYQIASIKILPPWYLSPLSIIIYVLLSIGLICWIINFFRVKNRLHIEKLEKKKILEQTQQKIKFMSNLSHDLKSPVGMIVTPISKLLLDNKNTEQKEMLEIVYKNAVDLNSKIQKLIEMNRIEDHEHILITSRIELISFIHELYEKHKNSETEIRHNWSFISSTEKLFVEMDIIKLESIICNLLTNAMKYTPDGGNIFIDIKYKKDDNNVIIEVGDNGIIIPENEQTYIFQRFFQSSATKNHYEGTGIGLYLVKTYTELHKGNVSVSSSEGKDTVFTLTFPIDKELNAIEVNDSENVNYIENTELPLMLIVDDNKDVYYMIRHILSKDYRFKYASNGKEALDIINKTKPDIIITDLMMPIMDGMEMCKVLKKNIPTSTIPIIMLSAKDDTETIKNSLKIQVDSFIQKPFNAEILIGKVNLLMHKKESFETQVRIENISTPQPTEKKDSADERFLIDITRIIEDHIADSDLNVNALSELSGTGNKQIYRKIKQLTGYTPVEYIKSIRMKKAAMLLQQKKFSIAEVMYMVGYSNPSYFSKCFQSVFGQTPKQYISEK